MFDGVFLYNSIYTNVCMFLIYSRIYIYVVLVHRSVCLFTSIYFCLWKLLIILAFSWKNKDETLPCFVPCQNLSHTCVSPQHSFLQISGLVTISISISIIFQFYNFIPYKSIYSHIVNSCCVPAFAYTDWTWFSIPYPAISIAKNRQPSLRQTISEHGGLGLVQFLGLKLPRSRKMVSNTLNPGLPWEPTTFIFKGYNPYIGGLKPSFFMVLGCKGRNYSNLPFKVTWGRVNKKLWGEIYVLKIPKALIMHNSLLKRNRWFVEVFSGHLPWTQ